MREHAAAEEGAKLLLDETRRWMFPERRTGEEAFQLLAHDLVKEGLLRFMALVLGHEVPDWDQGWNTANEPSARSPSGQPGGLPCGLHPARVAPAPGQRCHESVRSIGALAPRGWPAREGGAKQVLLRPET